MFEVTDLEVRYGEFLAVHGVSFSIKKGELATIIGANGAGKTSILRTLMGLEPAYRGTVMMNGKDITRLSPHERAKRGIGIVPEIDRFKYRFFEGFGVVKAPKCCFEAVNDITRA